MRAFHGQFSDNQPIRRNLAEKQKQLRDLKETLAGMKVHTSPALRDSVRKRIAELEVELRSAASAPADTQSAGGSRPDYRGSGSGSTRPLRGG